MFQLSPSQIIRYTNKLKLNKFKYFTIAQLVLLQTNWDAIKLFQKKVVTKEKSPQINSKTFPILCLVSIESSNLILKLWEPKCEHINCIQRDYFHINFQYRQPQKAQFPQFLSSETKFKMRLQRNQQINQQKSNSWNQNFDQQNNCSQFKTKLQMIIEPATSSSTIISQPQQAKISFL